MKHGDINRVNFLGKIKGKDYGMKDGCFVKLNKIMHLLLIKDFE